MASGAVPVRPGESVVRELRDRKWSEVLPFDPKRETSTFHVPTILMRTLLERAVASNLPLVAAPGIIAQLHPPGLHIIGRAHTIREELPDGGSNNWVRAHVLLMLTGAKDAYEAWFDFDATIIGKLIDAHENSNTRERARLHDRTVTPFVPTAPHWVGSHAFAPVFARSAEIAKINPMPKWAEEVAPRQVMGITEAALLADAHVLCIDPEQVAVLPEWEKPQEVFDYVADAVPPFDPLFLDLTGPGDATADFKGSGRLRDTWMALRGALVWRQARGMAGSGREVLMVAPFGWPVDAGKWFPDFKDDYAISVYESPGWFVFGEAMKDDNGGDVIAGEVRLALQSTDFFGKATACAGLACAGVEESLDGYAILPFNHDGLRDAARDADGSELASNMLLWGEIVWSLAAKALAALSITEAVEVEFVDAPVETRVRKRAAKRRWPIAQKVVIRSHTKRYRDHNTTGEEARYSHRFWRRATTAHYPLGTRMADANPELVTACNRPPESNCGFCRKVKRPACIVGPKDKPLVLKTLVRKQG